MYGPHPHDNLFPHNSRWKATNKHTGQVIVGRVREVTSYWVTLHTLKDAQIYEDLPWDACLPFEHYTFETHPFSARPIYAP